MICRLCLKDISEVIKIFDVVGLELNVAVVLGKYFWFEPKDDDPISTVICNSCWIKVSNFHEFYLSVEEAHRLLTERFSIKTEDKSKRERLSTDDASSYAERISKSEPAEEDTRPPWEPSKDGVNDEVEMQFSVLLEEDNDSNHIDESNVSESERKSFFDPVDTQMSVGILDPKLNNNSDEVSFDENFFVEKILDQATRLNAEEDKLVIKEEPVDSIELRRSTRNSKTSAIEKKTLRTRKSTNSTKEIDGNESDTSAEFTTAPKKRRGRPRKSVSENTENTCNKTCSKARLEMEQKSQTNDKKIASFMKLLCHICNQEESNFAKLRQHFRQYHQQPAYVTCCNKKFFKRVMLVEHIDKHLDPECYKCVDCNKIFADKQCMRNHMLLKHQPDEEKRYECEQCPKKFAKPYLLEQHMIIHAERNHICEECKRGFASVPLLTSHIKTAHSASYGTMCHICAKLIRGRAAFERHQLEHAGVEMPKVQCEKCGSWHKNKYSLQKHMRRHNEEGTLYICDLCNKVAPNRSALLSHLRYVHASERPYECSVCKKAFKKPINLREHMTMHTGEVLYSCPYCPKTFNSNANMHSHRKKMHPREFEEQRKLRRGLGADETTMVDKRQSPLTAAEPHNIIASTETKLSAGADGNDESIIFTKS